MRFMKPFVVVALVCALALAPSALAVDDGATLSPWSALTTWVVQVLGLDGEGDGDGGEMGGSMDPAGLQPEPKLQQPQASDETEGSIDPAG